MTLVPDAGHSALETRHKTRPGCGRGAVQELKVMGCRRVGAAKRNPPPKATNVGPVKASGRKARALPWTRWGREAPDPIHEVPDIMDRQQIIARLRENEAALRALGVAHAALFGSRPRGDARPASDTDILVQLDPRGAAERVRLCRHKTVRGRTGRGAGGCRGFGSAEIRPAACRPRRGICLLKIIMRRCWTCGGTSTWPN